jgi:HSP20 family protein
LENIKVVNLLYDSMSYPDSGDIEPFDWLNRFFGGSRRNRGWGGGLSFPDIFRSIDEMRRDMETEVQDMFKTMETRAPKDLIREYETPGGGKVREYGPFVYGYSMTVGPDGKPRVREFGNVKSPLRGRGLSRTPEISSEREPLADVTITDKEVKVVVEMPGVTKSNIKISAYNNSVEVQTTDGAERKYHEVIDLPEEADIETARSTYNNGILEIIFKKKDQTKPAGKQIKVD